jgi:hypothetical protein
VLAFGDSSSDPQVTVPISFVPAPTPSSGSQPSGSSVSQGGAASTASTSPSTASGTAAGNGSTLAFTGSGPGVWALAVGGIILIDLGFLVITIYYRPRELFAMARRQTNRILGFPPRS